MPVLPRFLLRLPLLCAAGAALVCAAADATPAPRPWEPDAFRPVTEARIAALPAAYAKWQAGLDR